MDRGWRKTAARLGLTLFDNSHVVARKTTGRRAIAYRQARKRAGQVRDFERARAKVSLPSDHILLVQPRLKGPDLPLRVTCTDAGRDPVRLCALQSGLAGPLDPAPPVTSPPRLTPRGSRRSAKDSFHALLGARGRLERNGRLSCPITPIATLHDTLGKATGGYQSPGGTLERGNSRAARRRSFDESPPLALPSTKVPASIRARFGPRLTCTPGLERRFRRHPLAKQALRAASNRGRFRPDSDKSSSLQCVNCQRIL